METLQTELISPENFNVVLITVQSNTDVIGMKYLHIYLRKNGINSRILVLPNYNESMNDSIEEFFTKHKPSLVGLGVLSDEFLSIERLITFLKSKFDFTVFLGGHYATINPEKCLRYADYVLMGEAEDTLLEICQKMKNGEDISSTLNLVYKKDNKIIKNNMRMPEQDLDKFPFHENLPVETYIFDDKNISLITQNSKLFRKYFRFGGRFYSLVTTRGCNLKCSYCIHSFNAKLYKAENLNVPRIRTRSVDNCIEELKIMKSQNPDIMYVSIQDENFFAHDIDWIREFSEKYKKEINIPLCCHAIPIFFTEDKAKLLKGCDLTWVFIGLQSGSERVLREIYQRHITNEQFLKCAEIVHKFNFVPYYDVIVDNVFETEEDVLKTLDVIWKIKKPYQLQLFSLAYFEGTVIYDMVKEKGIDVGNPHTKNYLDLKPDPLNRIIRLTPLLPNSFTKFLVKNRNNPTIKILLPIVYHTSIYTLEPLNFLKLIWITFDKDYQKTFRLIGPYLRTAFKKIILHRI